MRSMTGYGAGAATAPMARVAVEIRSVNQRFLDVKVTAPRDYAAWEREIRDRVRTMAERGRVEVTVVRTAVAARRRYAVAVRVGLARAYVTSARQLARSLALDDALSLADVLRLPDLFEVSEQPPGVRRELAAVRQALARALRAFDAERRREGTHLQRDMQRRTAAIRRATATIRRRLPAALAALRRQLEARLVRPVGGPELDRGRM